MHQIIRTLSAYALAPIMRCTGFRFSKAHRHGVTARHRVIYAVIDTVAANLRADRIN